MSRVAAAEANSTQASRSATASIELREGRAKPRAAGGRLAVDRQARPGQGAGAERALVGARVRVLEAAVVALEGRAPGEQVVGEGDGLRALHVRVAGHEGSGVPRGEVAQRVEGVEQAPRASIEALRSQSRRSRATWSLRLRPAWRLRPTSPILE